MAYSFKQRADKGFDFFNDKGQKVFIDEYVQKTGANKNQLVQNLANAGDAVSKQAVSKLPTQFNAQAQPRLSPEAQARIDATQAMVKKSQANVWNPSKILGDIGKGAEDLGRGIVSGLQQGAGTVGDVALQGGALLQRAGIESNPFTSAQQKQEKLKTFDTTLADGGGTQALRRTLQSQSDISGNKVIGTSNVDQNAANIAAGRGTAQDIAAVAGKGLETGLAATTFANPVSLARNTAGNMIGRQLLNFAGKDALLYGGTQGAATGAQTYGTTGDIGQALTEGLKSAALTGLTQGALDTVGIAARGVPKATTNTIQAVKESTPRYQAAQDPRVLGFDDQYKLLQQQFDTLPAGSQARRQVSQAMAENRMQRTTTAQSIQSQISQRGSIQVPGSGEPKPTRLSNVDSSERGNLNLLKEAKKQQYSELKRLRELHKNSNIIDKGNLRLPILNAKSAYNNTLAAIRSAERTIDSRAQEMGQTTKLSSPSSQVPGGKAEGQMWYHGTPRKFDTLKNNQTSYSENRNAGIGTWFSSDRNVADKFTYDSIYKNNPESKTGRVIEATPKLNNPKIYEPLSPSQAKQVRSNIESIENQIKETELQRKQYKDATINNNPSGYSWQTDREFTNRIDQLNGALKEEKIKLKDSYDVFQYEADKFDNKKAFADSLKQQGHDGIIIKKTVADASSGTNDQLVVFDIEASAPQVTKTPKQAVTQEVPTSPSQQIDQATPTEIVPQQVVEAPTAKSTFANQTVRTSKEVSDPLKAQVKSAEPTFQTVSDVERIAQSDKYLKESGIKKATTDIKERLSAKQVDDQTVSDAIAVAKALDQKGNPANLLEASAIYEELSVKLSKAGQTVQAASLLNNRTPAGLQYGAIRALKKSGVEITDQIKKDIGALVDGVRKTQPGSYEDGLARFNLQEYVAKQVPSGSTSKLIQLWKAGLLTSPRTTAGNLAGNTAESIFAKGYVDPLANVVDGLFSLFTGKRSRSYTLRGIGTGTKEGIQKGVSYFKTGYDPRNPAQKFDVRQIHYSDTPLGKAAETYTQTVFKLMGVADQPFYYANLRNSLYDQAITAAKNQGLGGADKQAFIKRFVTEPETKVMQLADAEARYAVFQNETMLGKTASRIKNMEGIPGDIAEFVIPFSGVPSSIATRMIERTPIGTAVEIAKQIKSRKFDQRAMTKAIANGSAAIPLIGAGAALAAAGQMTLGFPTDKKERDLWEAEGKQPYSIKVGDQWLSLNYFQPAGNLMAAGAEYEGAKMDGKTSEEAFSQALAGSAKAFSEQSFLKGVSSIGNAISDPSRFGQTFTESTAGSLVPNFIRTGARAFDPVKREVDNAGESIMAGIPGLREQLDAKTNILGQEVQRSSNPVNEIFNPTRPSDIQNADNPTIQELRRLQDAGEGIVPTEATKSSLQDLDTKELRAVNREVATQVASEWSGVLNDPRYESLIDADKKRILARVNDTVFGAVKSDYKESKLTQLQQQYKNGEPVNYFDGFDAAQVETKKAEKTAKAQAKKTTAKKSGSVRKFTMPETSKAFTQTQSTLKNLQSLLAGTSQAPARKKIGSGKVALRKINVKGA